MKKSCQNALFRLLLALCTLFPIWIENANSNNTGCNEGSLRFGSKCYDPYMHQQVSYETAELICKKDDQTVATFPNQDISSFLIITGMKYMYQEYSVDNGQRCHSISLENKFEIKEISCDDYTFAACEYDRQTDRCTWHNNKCYMLNYKREIARDAQTSCSEKGGRLASTKTSDEIEFLTKLVREDNSTSDWWEHYHSFWITSRPSDPLTFWSGKHWNGHCMVKSYNNSSATNCEDLNYFFCEYQSKTSVKPDITTTSSPNETEHVSTIASTSQSSTATPSVFVVSTTSTSESRTTIMEIVPKLIQFETKITVQENKATVLDSKPDTSDERTLKPYVYAIFGILGGIFVIIMIVIIQLYRLRHRKRLLSKDDNTNCQKQGPQSLPLLPISIYVPPSDDTSDVYTPPITTWINDGPRRSMFENDIYRTEAARSQMGSWYGRPNHIYEELRCSRTGKSTN